MKTRAKFFLSVTILSILLILGIPIVSAGGVTKVPVCHLDDEGNFILISIADPALDSHLAHGDGQVGVDVDESCLPLGDCPEDAVAEAAPGVNWQGCYVHNVNLSGKNLSGANLSRALLYAVNLSGADLSGANLSRISLDSLTLSHANLSYADLSYAWLANANMEYVDLSYANLLGLYILMFSPFDFAIWNNTTCPDGTITSSGCFQ